MIQDSILTAIQQQIETFIKHEMEMTAQHSKHQAFFQTGCIFTALQHYQTNAKMIKKRPRHDRTICKIGAVGLPKAMPKASMEIGTNESKQI